jgi:hypothetical protein
MASLIPCTSLAYPPVRIWLVEFGNEKQIENNLQLSLVSYIQDRWYQVQRLIMLQEASTQQNYIECYSSVWVGRVWTNGLSVCNEPRALQTKLSNSDMLSWAYTLRATEISVDSPTALWNDRWSNYRETTINSIVQFMYRWLYVRNQITCVHLKEIKIVKDRIIELKRHIHLPLFQVTTCKHLAILNSTYSLSLISQHR